jgi:hypothetical protein
MGLRGAFVVAGVLAAFPVIADEYAPDEAASAWKRHEVQFVYSGFTTRYSCGGLRSKVKLLLKHLGARPDIKITERGCDEGYALVAEFPRLKIVFYAPELPESGARDVGEPVLGVWKPVTIKRNSPRGLDMGDCELVEVFRDRVMPKFLTRNVQGDVNCIPHQLVGNRIDLRFEVLTGSPPADAVQALAN